MKEWPFGAGGVTWVEMEGEERQVMKGSAVVEEEKEEEKEEEGGRGGGRTGGRGGRGEGQRIAHNI